MTSMAKKEKYVEGIRSIFEIGRERRSKGVIIPSEWFVRFEEMNISVPEKLRWILNNVGMTIPEGMSDAEALEHFVDLLYNYYPREFVDSVIKKKLIDSSGQ